MPSSTSTSANAARTVGPALIAVLALLTAVAPLATDMYLPAFPHMATDLGTTAAGVQLTLTAFLIGLGLGQLLIGPLSDAVGRRQPLLVGCLVCLMASIGCALAPNVELLGTARFVQGLSGAAGVVLARAIISDTARGAAAARLLGVVMIIAIAAPVLAPVSGGAIITTFGWRAVFWALAVLALIMFVGSLLCAKETLPSADRTRGGFAATLHGARMILSDRNYTGYLLTFCFAFTALFSYISASPFVMQNVMGLSAGIYSMLFGMNALVIVVTSSIAAALAGKVSYRAMIVLGLSIAAVATTGLVICVATGVPTAPTLVMFAVFQGSLGFVFANTTTLALEEAREYAGTGSAFLGFLQFTLAAVIAPLVGLAGEDTALPMAIAMIVSIGLAVLAFTTLTRAATPEPETTEDDAAMEAARVQA